MREFYILLAVLIVALVPSIWLIKAAFDSEKRSALLLIPFAYALMGLVVVLTAEILTPGTLAYLL